ncbi:CoA-binding protein [Chloroflexota bacterium]
MKEINTLVENFLALKKIAIVGVSDQRETGCNLSYKKFKDTGYQVYAVNPRIDSFDGDSCYPNLRALPEKPDGVFILANPKVTELIVDECVEMGVEYVWMHCMMGTKPGLNKSMTSVSEDAVEKCRRNGIQVIPGSCPNQFLKPDPAHGMMKVLWSFLGFNSIKD